VLPIPVIRKLVLAGSVAALIVPSRAIAGGYAWPVKPFGVQHAVRGYLGDPRIPGIGRNGTLHFGVDIVAPNGTAVYATLDGIASRHPLHPDVVLVSAGAVVHEYWHVIPAVRPGQRVLAYRTIVGRIEKPWAHVHFTEIVCGVYLNPLRPGGLTPYRDTTRPTIDSIDFEREGRPVGARVAGTVDIVTEAWDKVPIPVPAPWNDKPVAAALIKWRLTGPREFSASPSWHIAVDFRHSLPTTPFIHVYARWTRQNRPWIHHGRGRYRFFLAERFDTHSLPNGTYRLVVCASDTAGNTTQAVRTFTVANGV